jgi:TonB family protein
MESDRLQRSETEYRTSLAAGLLVSVAVHLLLASLGGFLILPLRVRAEQPLALGYRGPQRPLPEIELLEPNSVQSFFSQRLREGRRHAPEYRLLQNLDPDPGPDPMPVRREERPQRSEEEPNEPNDDIQLVEPVRPTHQELSFSEDFVILKSVKPDYPEYERSRMIEGYVVIQCYVTAEGVIQDEQVTEAATSPVGGSTKAFERAALEAVKQWKVMPPLRDGKPRGAWLPIRINFDLTDLEF